jgi:hypothetical protein
LSNQLEEGSALALPFCDAFAVEAALLRRPGG